MKSPVVLLAVLAAMLLSPVLPVHAANLVASISISRQTMTVTQNGRVIHRWPVSTARKGYVTPRGSWRPTRMHRMWYSRKYDNSPMPYSVFYYGGYAIHGTNYVKRLGRPASHGCIRLQTANAATFYSLVQRHGRSDTRIVVTN
jgi:lipoprotein-anchoring transpeptidase ErfK/SrfK